MNPINTLNETAATHIAVKPTNRKAKMLAKLNRFGKRLALGSTAQYKQSHNHDYLYGAASTQPLNKASYLAPTACCNLFNFTKIVFISPYLQKKPHFSLNFKQTVFLLFTHAYDLSIILRHGEMAEWSNAPVLKTGMGLQPIQGSNPYLSTIF